MLSNKFPALSALSIALLALLAGCADEAPAAPQAPRTIKTIQIGELAGEQTRVIAGTTEADVVTELAFEVGGRLTELHAGLGEDVTSGSTIGLLDEEPYRLRVLTARGQLDQAQARLAETNGQFERIEDIFRKGYVSQAEFDSATANLESARANVRVARTQLELAQRDLARTRMTSPVDGTITGKYVETYTDVKPGQAIVQISALGRLKVNTTVPEALLRDIAIGDAVRVTFPDRAGEPATGRITEIGARAANTNAFPVVVTLDHPVAELPAGVAAEVTFSFASDATGTAFILPITAVLPSGENRTGTVFAFDPSSARLQARTVTFINVQGNRLEVAGDLQAGDIVAVAGVPFLHDGMSVRLLPGAAQ